MDIVQMIVTRPVTDALWQLNGHKNLQIVYYRVTPDEGDIDFFIVLSIFATHLSQKISEDSPLIMIRCLEPLTSPRCHAISLREFNRTYKRARRHVHNRTLMMYGKLMLSLHVKLSVWVILIKKPIIQSVPDSFTTVVYSPYTQQIQPCFHRLLLKKTK